MHSKTLKAQRSLIVKTAAIKIKATLDVSQSCLTTSLLHIIFQIIIDTSRNTHKIKLNSKFLSQSTSIIKQKLSQKLLA